MSQTEGAELNDGNSFTAYFKSDGLADDDIRGILEDAGGNLWISANNGLSRFNPTAKAFRNYHVWDGLAGNEFNSWGTPFKSDRGKQAEFALAEPALAAGLMQIKQEK